MQPISNYERKHNPAKCKVRVLARARESLVVLPQGIYGVEVSQCEGEAMGERRSGSCQVQGCTEMVGQAAVAKVVDLQRQRTRSPGSALIVRMEENGTTRGAPVGSALAPTCW